MNTSELREPFTAQPEPPVAILCPNKTRNDLQDLYQVTKNIF